jgi:hypothetical protein
MKEVLILKTWYQHLCTFITFFGVSLLEKCAAQIPCDFFGIVSWSVFYAILWPLVIFITCCWLYCMAYVIENILQPDSGTHSHTHGSLLL